MSFQQPLYSIFEGSSVEVCAELSLQAEIPVSVDVLTVEGGSAQLSTDFTISPPIQVLTFGPGEAQSCLTVLAVNDLILENDENFSLTLQSNDQFVDISTTDSSTTVMIPNQNSKIFVPYYYA